MKNIPNFIIVDDDPLNNSLCKFVIKSTLGETGLMDFTYPEEALEFLSNSSNEVNENTILFLDINMPRVNGWDFLKEYDTFNEILKNKISLYILSSSIDANDMEKAKDSPYVIDYLTKPLASETVLQITKV